MTDPVDADSRPARTLWFPRALSAALVLVFGVCIAWPALAFLGAAVEPAQVRPVVEAPRPPLLIALTTAGWALGVAAGAMLLGWGPGRLLGAALARGRGFTGLATLLLVPIGLPAYLVYAAWWQTWPPGSALHTWIVELDAIPAARAVTLWVGLVAWSWPLVSWCVALSPAAASARIETLLRLDRAPWSTRLAWRWRADRYGLLLGGLLVALLTVDNTTSFDLAFVFTLGNELRAQAALGAGPAEQLVYAVPSLLVVGAMVGAVAWLWSRRGPRLVGRPAPAGRAAWFGTLALVVVAVVVPFVALGLRAMEAADPWMVLRLYAPSIGSSLARAGLSAACLAGLALALACLWSDPRAGPRRLALGLTLGWAIAALLPGPIVASALESAWNRSWPLAETSVQSDLTLSSVIYRTPFILVLADLARFGFVAALIARAAVTVDRARARLDRLDGPRGFAAQWLARRPRLIGALTVTLLLGVVFTIAEVPVTARVHPTGSDPIAIRLLGDLHYQRPQIVGLAALALLAVLVPAAWLVARGLGRTPRRIAAVLVLGLALVPLTGCEPAFGDPIRATLTFGSPGTAPGQFDYPRACAMDRAAEAFYVIDKSARIQRFDFDGKVTHHWRMPAKENGKPTGISVAPDGRLFVADTHYFRVIAFDPEGNEVLRFGGHGMEPGRFIYPTDVAYGPEGRLYVSEYGGNDRIQVFDPDGGYLFSFGTFGSGDGQYRRPQSMEFSADLQELYIADSCNHRIVVTDPQGTVLRTMGRPGHGLGELNYPYGLERLEDGTLLVAEFGNHRIQHFAPDGTPLGTFGRAGDGDGDLMYPWGVVTCGRTAFVLDSGNNRVHRMRSP